MEERLQKLISKAGLASRRKAEQWIEDGRVMVNGQPANLGDKADLLKDDILVDGRSLCEAEAKITVLLNKPRGCVSSAKDPQGRKLVTDLVKDISQRLFPVGRLDYNTEGLILLTNDGELAQRMTHPKYHVEKTYLVKVRGPVDELVKQQLEEGLMLDDGLTAPALVNHIRPSGNNSWFELTIREGKNRQVRRMCEKVNLPVVRLKRIKVDFLTLGTLRSGEHRILSSHESKRLKKII